MASSPPGKQNDKGDSTKDEMSMSSLSSPKQAIKPFDHHAFARTWDQSHSAGIAQEVSVLREAYQHALETISELEIQLADEKMTVDSAVQQERARVKDIYAELLYEKNLAIKQKDNEIRVLKDRINVIMRQLQNGSHPDIEQLQEEHIALNSLNEATNTQMILLQVELNRVKAQLHAAEDFRQQMLKQHQVIQEQQRQLELSYSLLGDSKEECRRDRFEIEEKGLLEQLDSVASIWLESNLLDTGDGRVTLNMGSCFGDAFDLGKLESYYDQPVGGIGSAVLISKNALLTAGHLLDEPHKSLRVVFGFHMRKLEEPVTTVPAANVFKVHKVHQSSAKYSPGRDSGFDLGVITLDRDVPEALARPSAVSINREHTKYGTRVHVIGHPCGLPVKFANGPRATISDDQPKHFFHARLDAYGGNAGSPVWNTEEKKVIGIRLSNRACVRNSPQGCTMHESNVEKVARLDKSVLLESGIDVDKLNAPISVDKNNKSKVVAD